MSKLSMFIGSGMISVFNTTWVFQKMLAAETPPDIVRQISPETAMEFFREFGLPTGFAIVFGMVCVAGAIRWYRDLKSMIELRDTELLKKDHYILELTEEIKQLTRDSAKFKAKLDAISDKGGGKNENAK